MTKILVSWIGRTDLNAAQCVQDIGHGPIAQAILALPFDHVVLLSDYPPEETKAFLAWLTSVKPLPASTVHVTLTSPTNFSEIYEAAVAALKSVYAAHGQDISLTFHLSPGTPAMAAVWMLLAKTLYPATLIQSSKEQGVVVADIPFDISAEFIPSLRSKQDGRLEQMIAALPPEATNVLKDHIVKGYTINEQRFREQAEKLTAMQQTVALLARTLTNQELLSDTGKDVLRVITDYAYALTLLDRYDHGTLAIEETTRQSLHIIDYDEAAGIINSMRGEFDGLFGIEKDQGLKSALGAIYQTFGGEELYPGVEEKAANLLYFVVKNHAFSDGNKRIAAALFIYLPRQKRHPLPTGRQQASGRQRRSQKISHKLMCDKNPRYIAGSIPATAVSAGLAVNHSSYVDKKNGPFLISKEIY